MNTELLDAAVARTPFTGSDFAASVDLLFYAMLAACSLTIVIITALIVIFCIRYRRGRQLASSRHYDRAHYLEYVWIVLALLLFSGFFFWGASVFLQLQRLPREAMVIQGIGKQWMWKFYHAGGQTEINTLHVPMGRPVILRLASEDVIHSFFVPGFRIKQDVVPGTYTYTWFQARRAGVYRLFCAEYCGTEHSQMRGAVHVMPADDFDAWLASSGSQASHASAGKRLFRKLGCGDCHDPGSGVSAPDLAGLYGSTVQLSDGGAVEADLAYLRNAILLPERQVAAGYQPIMPSYAGQVDEEQLFTLLNYLQSLGAQSGLDNTSDAEASP